MAMLFSIGCVDVTVTDDVAADTGDTDTGETGTGGCDSQTWYTDADGDGFGLDASATKACEAPADSVEVGGDCDDEDPEVNPAARDIYDGLDNDCNSAIDDLPHWGYSDEDDHIPPGEWADWWPSCGGENQSPVDLVVADIVDGGSAPLELDYVDTRLLVTNNGHTLEWTVDAGSALTWAGETYPLRQLHIHAASERTLMGEHWPLEIHLVHIADQGTQDKSDDRYVVLAVPVREGAEDPFMDSLGWAQLPVEAHDKRDDPATTYNPMGLLPPAWFADPTILTYAGSLTTPPCTEGVQWVILGHELELGTEQIAVFTSIYADNFRPVQPLGDREVSLVLAEL